MNTKKGVLQKHSCLWQNKYILIIYIIICVIMCIGCTSRVDGVAQTGLQKELHWDWVLEADQYADIIFVDKDVIAVRNDEWKWALFDLKEGEVTSFTYELVFPFYDGISLVRQGGNYFYIDNQGIRIGDGEFENAGSFSDSLAAVEENGLWGYIDRTGRIVISCQYSVAKRFSENMAAVQNEDKWGYIGENGQVILDFEYQEADSFSEGFAIVKVDGLYGIIDKTGRKVVECNYDMVRNFSEGYAAVQKNGKWGYVDENGRECVALIYDDATDFSEGMAAVKKNGKEGEVDQWAYIDYEGNIKIDFYSYSAIEGKMVVASEFHNGLAFVSKDVYTVIDTEGKNVFDIDSKFFISALVYNDTYDVIPGYVFTDESMLIKKYGLVGLKGEVRLEPQFDYIGQIEDKYVIVYMNRDGMDRAGIIALSWEAETDSGNENVSQETKQKRRLP